VSSNSYISSCVLVFYNSQAWKWKNSYSKEIVLSFVLSSCPKSLTARKLFSFFGYCSVSCEHDVLTRLVSIRHVLLLLLIAYSLIVLTLQSFSPFLLSSVISSTETFKIIDYSVLDFIELCGQFFFRTFR